MVYQTADKLGISNLLGAAFDKIQALYEEGVTTDDQFLSLVEQIYGSTGRGDTQLRAWITTCCIKENKHAMVGDKLKQLMLDHEPVAWSVGQKLVSPSRSNCSGRDIELHCQACGL